MPHRVLVIGAGVSGLSSALALSEAGYDVEILTDRPSLDTTSAVAAACWYPFHVGPYDHRWAERTHEWFMSLVGRAGVTTARCHEYFESPLADAHVDRDFWWRRLPGIDFELHPHPGREGPKTYVTVAHFTVPVVRMPDYLQFLLDRLAARGVRVHQQNVQRLDDVAAPDRTVVNCTALGSARLCNDTTLFAAQGHVVVVENFGLTEMLFGTGDEAWPIYLIPRGPDTVLGGTFRPNQWGEHHSPADTSEILTRCAQLDPRARTARPVQTKVGLRPCRRTGPRVEAERRGRAVIVHNYGHAGGGVTLSWGCAEAVVKLVDQHSPSASSAFTGR